MELLFSYGLFVNLLFHPISFHIVIILSGTVLRKLSPYITLSAPLNVHLILFHWVISSSYLYFVMTHWLSFPLLLIVFFSKKYSFFLSFLYRFLFSLLDKKNLCWKLSISCSLSVLWTILPKQSSILSSDFQP